MHSSMKLFVRHFSKTSGSKNNKLPNIAKIIPCKKRSNAIKQAQEALVDYLHGTRLLPFTFAELVTNNSTHSLYHLLKKVPFDDSINFRKNFQSFLRYNPINEVGFFLESIGIDYADVNVFLKSNMDLFEDGSGVFDAASCLSGFGFPWDKLGKLYVEEVSIFEKKTKFLTGRLDELVLLGFSNEQIVGICLSFPGLLNVDNFGLCSDFDALLSILKRVIVDFDSSSSVVGNVDFWCKFCSKFKVFYDLGVASGEAGDLMVKDKSILTEFSEEVLVEKVKFFSGLGIEKVEVGMLILSNTEILRLKLNDRVISVLSLLNHFGLCKKKLEFVEQNYKHVIGRNKMINLPNILRAIDLHEWFIDKMKCGHLQLLANYDLSSLDDGVDDTYVQKLESLKSGKTYGYSVCKLDILHGIGFGENGSTMELLCSAHGSPGDLQQRFDFILSEGIEFSKLCKMMLLSPKIFSQSLDSLEKKIVYLRDRIGLPLAYMEKFPYYLLFSLEDCIKPRYEFYMWLIEQGLCNKRYTLSSLIAVSQKSFLYRLSCIHPHAPRLWLERHGKI